MTDVAVKWLVIAICAAGLLVLMIGWSIKAAKNKDKAPKVYHKRKNKARQEQ